MITTPQEPTIFIQGISLSDLVKHLKEATASLKSSDQNDEVMDVQEAAAFLRVSVPTVWRKKLKNEIPYTQLNGRVVFLRSQLIAWISAKSNSPKVHTR